MNKMNDVTNKSLRKFALDLIDSDELREQANQLLEEFLPHVAADIENDLHEQEAKVFYEIFTDHESPKIRVVLKLKKLDHEVLIHLDSRNAMFVIGSERGCEAATNAMHASSVVKTVLMRVRSN